MGKSVENQRRSHASDRARRRNGVGRRHRRCLDIGASRGGTADHGVVRYTGLLDLGGSCRGHERRHLSRRCGRELS